MTCGHHVRPFGVVHDLSHTEDKMKTLNMSILLIRKPEDHE